MTQYNKEYFLNTTRAKYGIATLPQHFDEKFCSDYTHVRPFNTKGLSRLLTDYGFTAATLGSNRRAGLCAAGRLFHYVLRGGVAADTTYPNAAGPLLGGETLEAFARRA
jgi:hypothetical protein